MTTNLNSSYVSYYVDDKFYENLLKEITIFDDSFLPVSSELKEHAERILYTEARYVDELRLEDWLNLFSKECLYWIPTVPGGGDPRKVVSIAFDDRRRLEDRVYRLRTGYAYSQLPMSRTRRMLSNLEVTQGEEEDTLFVRANIIIYEFRVGKLRSFAGWCGYKLIREDGDWKIAIKMVNLIDCDQGHENLTFIL